LVLVLLLLLPDAFEEKDVGFYNVTVVVAVLETLLVSWIVVDGHWIVVNGSVENAVLQVLWGLSENSFAYTDNTEFKMAVQENKAVGADIGKKDGKDFGVGYEFATLTNLKAAADAMMVLLVYGGPWMRVR